MGKHHRHKVKVIIKIDNFINIRRYIYIYTSIKYTVIIIVYKLFNYDGKMYSFK